MTNSFIQYLADVNRGEDKDRLPSLSEISQALGISVASLREQMEVARAFGMVEARPRTGMRRLPYAFLPAVQKSLFYSISLDPANFQAFADLRQHIEFAYWHEAVRLLNDEDKQHLQDLISSAWGKLRGTPVQIPHAEHRELHLYIYKRLDNPFVTGLLEAYWQAYERVGLSTYTDYAYLEQVWRYHEKMVTAICEGQYEAGYQALVEHTALIAARP